jgi:transposase
MLCPASSEILVSASLLSSIFVAPVAASIKSHEEFARMIETHWEDIVAFYRLENKISFGLVEGLNNKIRVMQRRA